MPAEHPLLRTQLLAWLLLPLLALLTADSFISYWIAASFSERAYDRSLVEIARETSLHLKAAGGGLQLDMSEEARRVLFFTDPSDRIHFALHDSEGRRLAGDDIPPPGARTRAGEAETFYDGQVAGVPVRIVEVRVPAETASGRPAALIRVAETGTKRRSLANEILLSVVVPQVLLVLIAGALVWQGVVRGLRPLQRLQRAVAARSHLDLRPLNPERVPGEALPLVTAINDMLGRLQHALTLQSRFIADAAHQLKTPIAALLTQIEVALRESDPASMRRSLQESQSGLERLARLASQLLSLARNEPEAAGSVALRPLDLREVALEAASAWVPAALARDLDLGFEDAEGPVQILGDAARLRELFDNLLDNAVRYSRAGGRITVRVLAHPAPAVEISDDGPGIPPEERMRIFERFHRLLGAPEGGSGLGLAIAREIVRIHGGGIDLRADADGVGTTFVVNLPKA
jgi:two-component system sensor histidine kinase TctE